jgi:hypothetical protein
MKKNIRIIAELILRYSESKECSRLTVHISQQFVEGR